MKFDEKHCKNNEHQWKLMKNIAKTMKNNEIWWNTWQKQWKTMKIDEKHCKNNEKPMKIDEKHCKNNEKPMKIDEKHCKNNEKPMKIDEKHCKNNEKIMKRFGPRTSTQQLARGLRPNNWPEDLDPSTRGTTTGHYNGETQRGNKRGTNGKHEKWKNEKNHIYKF